MRKFKLMPLVLLASVFGLSACTLPKWLSFLSFIPGLEAPEEEKEEKKEKEEEEEKKEKVVHSAAEIAADIAASLGVEVGPKEYDGKIYAYSTNTGAGDYNIAEQDTSTFVDDASEQILLAVTNAVSEYMPEYLADDDYWFYDGVITEGMTDEQKEEHDYWGDEDGSTALEQYFLNEDETVEVDILAYCYTGYPLFRVTVWDLAVLAELNG